METHRMLFINCWGSRRSHRGPCDTPIGLVLDIGPSAFRCPVCDAVSIIDPLYEGSPWPVARDLSYGKTEVDGHIVEMFSGERIWAICKEFRKAEAFYTKKVGGISRVFDASVYLKPVDIMEVEIESATDMMREFMPGRPFTRVEQALGLMAFGYWLELGTTQSDGSWLDRPENSARQSTISFVDNVLSTPDMRLVIWRKVSSFSPESEVRWAKEKATHEQWMTCLTRVLILLCRAHAYRYTGVTGEKSGLLKQLSLEQITSAAVEIYRQNVLS